MISLACPGCGRTVQTPDSNAGKKGRCPDCRTIFSIPADGGPAVAVAAPSGSASAGPPSTGSTAPVTRSASATPNASPGQGTDEAFEFSCRSCGHRIRAKPIHIGKMGRCTKCQETQPIPAPGGVASRPVASRPAASVAPAPPRPASGTAAAARPGRFQTTSPTGLPSANDPFSSQAGDPFAPAGGSASYRTAAQVPGTGLPPVAASGGFSQPSGGFAQAPTPAGFPPTAAPSTVPFASGNPYASSATVAAIPVAGGSGGRTDAMSLTTLGLGIGAIVLELPVTCLFQLLAVATGGVAGIFSTASAGLGFLLGVAGVVVGFLAPKTTARLIGLTCSIVAVVMPLLMCVVGVVLVLILGVGLMSLAGRG